MLAYISLCECTQTRLHMHERARTCIHTPRRKERKKKDEEKREVFKNVSIYLLFKTLTEILELIVRNNKHKYINNVHSSIHV